MAWRAQLAPDFFHPKDKEIICMFIIQYTTYLLWIDKSITKLLYRDPLKKKENYTHILTLLYQDQT